MSSVVLHDVDLRTDSFIPSPPASAYFVAGTKATKDAVVLSERSDAPGGIFVVHDYKALPILTEGLQRDKVTIAFARERGGMDIHPLGVRAPKSASGQRTIPMPPLACLSL